MIEILGIEIKYTSIQLLIWFIFILVMLNMRHRKEEKENRSIGDDRD